MSATTQTPIVPPRPTHTQDAIPKIPPRPIRRAIDRSVSPNRDRFAPSPLNNTLLSKSPLNSSFSNGHSLLVPEPVDRAGSVDLPSLGQEGMEYAAVEELSSAKSQADDSRASSPEHTRTVGEDIKLHAPKPSLPAVSAKHRVAAVTTDSDRAASFDLGQSGDYGTHKNASTTSQDVSSDDLVDDDEQGIPEIGRQVPMYPNAGDVQAPTSSVGPDAAESVTKYHRRKRSAQLPPGSYGLHGHGVIPSDRLEQAYYSKHPELIQKEHTPHHADRTKDFSRPSAELNRIVHDVAHIDLEGTPSEQVGWKAIDETISRPTSVAPKAKSSSFGSQSSAADHNPQISISATSEDGVIHVEDPSFARRKSVLFQGGESAAEYETEAPILAADEVAKDPLAYEHAPAVEPEIERRLSAFDGDAHSRPASVLKSSQVTDKAESGITAEEEYEPLFKDDKAQPKAPSISSKSINSEEVPTNRFPSRDVWEDAPKSAFYTAEVSTPDLPDDKEENSGLDVPSRNGETPAQAFARHQEELAEVELRGRDLLSENRKPSKVKPWAMQQQHLAPEVGVVGAVAGAASVAGKGSSSQRPTMTQRFPSRDVWEDAPESLQLQTVVSHPQEEDAASPSPVETVVRPEVQQQPARKLTDSSSEKATVPAVPSRPKPKTLLADDHGKPAVPERPKPQMPARPARQQLQQPSTEEDNEPVRAKPAVPARAFGGKIAQLQANFMSDLNKKLKIGPQAPKKEETAEAAEGAAEGAAEQGSVPKAPLADARKGRARGPQRRAPRSSPSPAAAVVSHQPVTLGFSTLTTLYSIDPEEGVVTVSAAKGTSVAPIAEEAVAEAKTETSVEEEAKEEAAAEETGEKTEEKTKAVTTDAAGEMVEAEETE